MNSFIEVQINQRFFQALEQVISLGLIRGVQTFTREHNIDRRNLLRVKKEPTDNSLNIEWIYHLVNDFNISADWILTGKGSMFK